MSQFSGLRDHRPNESHDRLHVPLFSHYELDAWVCIISKRFAIQASDGWAAHIMTRSQGRKVICLRVRRFLSG